MRALKGYLHQHLGCVFATGIQTHRQKDKLGHTIDFKIMEYANIDGQCSVI